MRGGLCEFSEYLSHIFIIAVPYARQACSIRYARLRRASFGTHASGVLHSVGTPQACFIHL